MISRDANRPQQWHESIIYAPQKRRRFDIWPGDCAYACSWDSSDVTLWRFNGEGWREQ